MVKFSHGCWHPAPDTIIDWAVEVVKGVANEDNLHFVTVSILSRPLKTSDFKQRCIDNVSEWLTVYTVLQANQPSGRYPEQPHVDTPRQLPH